MTTKKDKPASIQKEYRKVSQLKNWDKNPRNIKEKDFERLKTQIRDLKQYKPLLITDDGIVLGGNMRLRAYRDLGTEEVWVSVVDAPDEETKMRYALSDNDRAGYYDGDMLANLTGEYPDFNWEDYAVDLKEPQTLDDLIKSLTPVEEDDVPEISDEPARSEYGKVYQLGRHRLMCGDATKIEDVEKLMNGQKADMVFTDPPFNIGVDYESHDDKQTKANYVDLIEKALTNLVVFSKDAYILVMSANKDISLVKDIFEKVGIHYHQLLIWGKPTGALGSSDYVQNYEVISYGYVGKYKGVNQRGKLACEIIGKDENITTVGHPTSRPLELLRKYLTNNSKSDDIVLDLFGGSGSTLIACEQTNRTCYMMELDPKYCDVIRKRYENFINKEDR